MSRLANHFPMSKFVEACRAGEIPLPNADEMAGKDHVYLYHGFNDINGKRFYVSTKMRWAYDDGPWSISYCIDGKPEAIGMNVTREQMYEFWAVLNMRIAVAVIEGVNY